jgi:hypothetical protein
MQLHVRKRRKLTEAQKLWLLVLTLSGRSALHFAAMHNAALPATIWYSPD